MAEPVPPEEPGMPRPSPRSGDDHARPAWLEGIEPDGGEGAAGTPAGPPPPAAAFALPRAPIGDSLAGIRRHPELWDGRRATVSGKVGEVYAIAGGWAFYLHQGRDTIVTFVRSQAPLTGARIRVTGDVQTGYL